MRPNLLTTLTAVAAILCGCNKGDDQNSNGAQRERIIKYTESLSTPVSERDGVFITRLNTLAADPASLRVEPGDSVWIDYAMYTFFSKPDSLFATNIAALAEENGFDTHYMSLEPLAVKYGETEIIKGFARGINNALEHDSLMIFVPSELAYDNKMVGIVKKSTTIAIFADIKKIRKHE
ncbi:MAG: FKBP-type peptidyl-prolyl cis-trans isomerase [Rikenellaceae bacterium]|nr:FKBP-type peptidyl-prolyl cis-trans isomerase [Rikenellaceae bacterium]